MAVEKLTGTIISSPIYPSNTGQTFATLDSDYGKGGYRSVKTIAERDAITYSRRKVGMEVRVTEGEGKGLYVLTSFKGSAIKGVTSQEWEEVKSASVLENEITISGGPLADKATGLYENNVIPAGTSIEDILSKLLCTEEWPNVGTKDGSFSIKPAAPSIILKDSSNTTIASGSTVEVGTCITITLTSSNSSVSKQSSEINGLTYGYYNSEKIENEDGSIEYKQVGNLINPSSKKITSDWTVEQVPTYLDGETTKYYQYSFSSVTVTGFRDVNQVSSSDSSSSSTLGDKTPTNATAIRTRYVAPGSNSVSGTLIGGPKCKGYIAEIEPVFYKSSLNNTRMIGPVAAQGSVDDMIVKDPGTSSAGTVSLTGVYPCFTNISELNYTSYPNTKLELTTGKQFFFEIPNENGQDYRFMFSYPGDRTLKLEILTDEKTNTFQDYEAGFTDESDSDRVYGSVTYKTWSWTSAKSGGGKVRITLSKNLNS